MANTLSALKRVRQIKRRTQINSVRKSRVRRQIRALRKLIDAKDVAAAEAAVPVTYSLIDRAVKWGVFKDNTAARFKSRLSARLKALASA